MGRAQLAQFISAPRGVSWTQPCCGGQLAGQLVGPGWLHSYCWQLAGTFGQSMWQLQQAASGFLVQYLISKRTRTEAGHPLTLLYQMLAKASYKASPY